MRFILSLFITAVALLLPARGAAIATGTWERVGVYGSPDALAETDAKLYFLTAGSLYCYDKEYGETRFMTLGDDISDSNATALYADPAGKRVAVVYDNSNIDILTDEGARINLPDIKAATLDDEKGINDLAFSPDGKKLYAATDFGMVVFDIDRAEVKESGMYHFAVGSVIATPDYIVISVPPTENAATPYYSIAAGESLRNFKSFNSVGSLWGNPSHWYPLGGDGNKFLAAVYTNQLKVATVGTDGRVGFESLAPRGSQIVPTKTDGVWVADNEQMLRRVNASGELSLVADNSIPSLEGRKLSARGGASLLWLADSDGIGSYRLATDGTLTALTESYRPSPVTTFKTVCSLFPTADGQGVIAMNIGDNQNHPFGKGMHENVRLAANIIIPGADSFESIDPDNATAVTSPGSDAVRANGPYIYSPTFIAESPVTPGTYYIGSGTEGIYVVQGGKVVAKWDADAGIHKTANYIFDVQYGCFDAEGNLWIGLFVSGDAVPAIRVLPAAKLRKDPREITASDWLTPKLTEGISGKDIRILHCSKSPVTFIIDSNYSGFMGAIYNAGTPGTMSDDRVKTLSAFVDRDGVSYPQVTLLCMAEDRNGQVWVGTMQGIFVIPTPTDVFNADFRVVRPKMPRNDGTNLADYLLDGEKITAITIDHANRKWVATEGSGLFLVSPSGDEILANYTADNSLLPTSVITSLWQDPNSNLLYVGTLEGLYVLASTSAPGRPDYSEVYAYPNPLTPEFSGWVTITGLMEGSLVKIVDSAMHLVAQTTADGGQAMWDGCDMSGARVRAGVYYVLASTGADGTSSSGDVVTKILVIN